jgi:hypothetical protein
MPSFIAAYLCAIVFASILEWIVHKEFMHSVRFMRRPHQRHAVEHHAQRRAPGKFFAKPDELKEYHLFETSFMPILWLLHTPLFCFVGWLLGTASGLGFAAGTLSYVLSYELLHWSIHCPDDFLFRNARWFHFLVEHHRRHHNRSDINYNVVLPLADVLFGTLSYRDVRPEPETVAQAETPSMMDRTLTPI